MKKEKKEFSDISQGGYMLRVNIIDWSGEELWRALRYTIARCRKIIQDTKSYLELRPKIIKNSIE